MKKVFFILLIIYLNPLFAFQNVNQNFEFGVLLGFHSSYLKDDPIRYDRPLVSFLPGLIVDYKLDENWIFRSGLYYSLHGGTGEKMEQTTEEPYGTGKYFWQYFQDYTDIQFSFQL